MSLWELVPAWGSAIPHASTAEIGVSRPLAKAAGDFGWQSRGNNPGEVSPGDRASCCRDGAHPRRGWRGANCPSRRAEAGGSGGKAAQSAPPGSPANQEAFAARPAASWGAQAGAEYRGQHPTPCPEPGQLPRAGSLQPQRKGMVLIPKAGGSWESSVSVLCHFGSAGGRQLQSTGLI